MARKIGSALAAAALTAAAALSTPALATIAYTYDDLGRVTSITYDDGKRVTYSYDPAGNRTQHVVTQTVNQPPTAVDDFISIDIAFSYSFVAGLVANDTDPDPDILTIQSVTTPMQGTAVIGGGGGYVTYTFTGSFHDVPTTDTFDYTISDGRGGTSQATVNVEIWDSGGPCVPPPGQQFCDM